MPLTEHELQLIVFAPDDSPLLIDVPGVEQIEVSEQGNVSGLVALGGTHRRHPSRDNRTKWNFTNGRRDS